MSDDMGGYRQINKSLNICAFEEYLKGQAAQIPHLDSVEQLSPRVLRVLGANAGKFTLQGTNTYILGTGRERILIDTSGGEPEWAERISATLESHQISLSHVLLTHWHGDHTGGVPDLIRLQPELAHAIYKNEPDQGQQNMVDGQVFRVAGATVRALHVPGHSSDHVCCVLEEEHAMFTGDNVLGHGTSAVEDLGTFMHSLERMRAQHCTTGYPAHGAVIADLPSKLSGELRQKLRRERQVLTALGDVGRRGERGASVEQLVTAIYGDSLDPELRTTALEPFIEEVLRKLAGDGDVAFVGRKGVRKWYSVVQTREPGDMEKMGVRMEMGREIGERTWNSSRSGPVVVV